ncbi:chromatin structure-remodeling complex subunit RSC7 [Sporobolomyces salmoneus]|uniref:chromatin structure-remodeling complex subunit RSC7 n=1 Tax=Sporobolomyces salmoneus TaxID=183962 RepID=UPI00316F7887
MNPHQFAPPPPAARPAPPAAPSPVSYVPFPSAFQTPADSPSYSRATSTDPGGASTSVGILTGEVGTPMGIQSEDDQMGPDSAVGTPLPVELEDSSRETPQPAVAPAPVKRSKALNFLKKKETKVNVKGVSYKIVDDEIILEDDPRGETKIDENGILLGGRNWKVHTFTSPMRTNTEKLYMLSIDAARCAGFRDSLYFFRRNPLIHKLSCSQAEKDRLIELGKLSGNLKSRAVTMVSARNVFKVMGATFVQDGKYILDDYYEGKSLAAGHTAGEPAFIEPYDPEKDTGTLAVSKGNAPPGATSLGLNVLIGHPGKPKMPGSELISSQIGGGLHATFGGNGLQPFGKSWDPSAKKAKPASHLTVEDWMYEYAKEVGEHNRRYQAVRTSHVGQVAISLGVEEKEEDCWEMVEEEYTDDEEVKPVVNNNPALPPPPPVQTSAFQLPSVSSQPSPFPPPQSQPAMPSLPSLYNPLPTSASSTPAPPPVAPAPRPKKKRLTKRFNPIRGFYELETNVPHVYRSTQPTTVLEFYRQDQGANIYPEEISDGEKGKGKSKGKGKRKEMNGTGPSPSSEQEEEEKRKKRRQMELAAGTRGGIASLEFVSYEQSWNLEDEGHRAREPLIPGMWDFGAGPQVLEGLKEEEEVVQV